MTNWPGIRRIFRLDRGDVQRGVDDELQFHFHMKVKQLIQQGVAPEQAPLEAARQFGDLQMTRRTLTAIDLSQEGEQRRAEWLGNFVYDLRVTLRGLRGQPGFTVGVLLTLSLGIGANVTMFGVVDQLLFRPPAYLLNPASVNRVYLARTVAGSQKTVDAMAYPRYLDLTKWTSTLAQTAAVNWNSLAIGSGEDVQKRPIQEVSASYWSFFSAGPVVGRFFTPEEDRPPNGTAVAVLGYGYWQTAFGGAHDVVGKHVQIGTGAYTIIGVAPEGFTGDGAQQPAAFVPITAGIVKRMGPEYTSRYGWESLSMLVRRKPGITATAATADLTNAYLQSYAQQRELQPNTAPSEIARPHALAGPLLIERGPKRSAAAQVAIWLIGVAMIVLIIACANVGNLLLGRALSRRRDVAVRLALGISRSRLLTQCLGESLLLSLMGAVSGVALAHWGGAAIRRSLISNAADTPAWTDGRTLIFALAAALFAGLMAGIVPSIQTTRTDLTTVLKSGGRDGGRSGSTVRNGLLVVQASLSLVLLVGAGLFVRSLRQAQATPLGYDADRIAWAFVQMRDTQLSEPERIQLASRLLGVARAIPEVEAAAQIVSVPFQFSIGDNLFVTGIDSVKALGDFREQYVSGDYFRVMGTRILRGRAITETESHDTASRVMVVSQSMARTLWPRADAIGQCVRMGADTMPCTTVIGIAQDIRTASLLDDPGLQYYVPVAALGGSAALFLRTRGDPARHAEAIRRALQREMPGTAFMTVQPFADIMKGQTRSWQLGATMFTIFGGLALLVAAVGLYSVVAFGVARRRQELSVRMALGAQAKGILQLVLGEVLRTALLAVVIGGSVVLLAARWVQPLLFRVSPRDPAMLGACAALLVVIAMCASIAPALRAARTDPNAALRAE